MRWKSFFGFMSLGFGICTYVTDYDQVHHTDMTCIIPTILIVCGALLLSFKEE